MEIGKEFNIYVHIDASKLGLAPFCPEHRGLLEGVEGANCIGININEWMPVGMNSSILYVKSREIL